MAGKLLPLSNFSQDKSICNSESQVTPRRTSLSLEDMGKEGSVDKGSLDTGGSGTEIKANLY